MSAPGAPARRTLFVTCALPVRQRPGPPGPHGRARADGHLRAVPAQPRGRRGKVPLRRRHPRRANRAERAQEQGVTPEAILSRMGRREAPEGLPPTSASASITTADPTNSAEKTKHYAELIYGRAKDAGSIVTQGRRAAVRNEKSKRVGCRTASSAARAPTAAAQRPVRRRLREVQRDLHAARAEGRALVHLRRAVDLGRGSPSHLFFALAKREGGAFLREQLKKPGLHAPRGPASAAGGSSSTRASPTGTSPATGRTSGFRIPGGQEDGTSTSTSGWTRPSATSRSTEQWAKKTGRAKNTLAYWDEASERRGRIRGGGTSSGRTSSTSTASSGPRC